MSSKSRQTDVYVHGLEENLIEESPKHGPTLSTSTSSVGGIKTYDPRLELTSKAFFTQAENYIVNEMETINIDYRMLSQMNSLMQNNYAQILPNVIKLKKNSDDIAQRYSKLVEYASISFYIYECLLQYITFLYFPVAISTTSCHHFGEG